MELNFIRARTLEQLQQIMQELSLRILFVPQFHPPIYDGTNWVITWYSPIDTEGIRREARGSETT